MDITKADFGDIAEIHALQMLAFQSQAVLLGKKDIPPLRQTQAEIEAEWQSGTVILKAVQAGDILGSVRGYVQDGTAHVGKLMVHPAHRGKGFGARLLLAAEAALPAKRYELFTSALSVRNLALYQKHGYREYVRRMNGDMELVYLQKLV